MSKNVIIKIAVGVSAAAALFSVVTLIRAIVIRSNIVLPVIQVVGSVAIFAVCLIMLRVLSAAGEDEDEADDSGTEKASRDAEASDGDVSEDQAVDELFEKYHLSDFEEAKQEQE